MTWNGRGFRHHFGCALAAGALFLGGCGNDAGDGRPITADGGGAGAGTPTIGAGPATGGAQVQRQPGTSVSARFIDLQGRDVGEVTLEEGTEGVFIHGQISGLTGDMHGFHIHEVGRCEPPFESAGGHLNPGGRQHGLVNSAGPHAGDLTNLAARADGTARIEAFAPLVTLGTGADGLLGGDGASLVVHANRDDHRTDPTGNSGDRIACAVLQR
jgi:superoxide dismutase, Cu-Zn family